MRQAYFSFLLESNQEERAAELKAREHDFLQAIKLYMKGVTNFNSALNIFYQCLIFNLEGNAR